MRAGTFKRIMVWSGRAIAFAGWLCCSVLLSYGIMYKLALTETKHVYTGGVYWQAINPPEFWHPHVPVFIWILAILAGLALGTSIAMSIRLGFEAANEPVIYSDRQAHVASVDDSAAISCATMTATM